MATAVKPRTMAEKVWADHVVASGRRRRNPT